MNHRHLSRLHAAAAARSSAIAIASAITVAVTIWPALVRAQDTRGIPAPPPTIVEESSHSFPDLVARLERAVEANKMGLVGRASASAGAAARGVKIPGNLVLMVFRNDYAVRMLEASVPAGFEAPLRFYVTEGGNGKASVSYRKPSTVFAPYHNAALDAMARELDPVFEKIVRDAV